MLRSIFAPGLDVSTDNSTLSSATTGGVRATKITTKHRTNESVPRNDLLSRAPSGSTRSKTIFSPGNGERSEPCSAERIDQTTIWCREGDLNPHNPFGSADFKSAASASFAIPAPISGLFKYRTERHSSLQRAISSNRPSVDGRTLPSEAHDGAKNH